MENPNNTALAVKDQNFLGEVNPLNESQVAAFATAKTLPFDMAANYWTPTAPGESKRLIFQGIATEQAPDFADASKMVDLEVARFVEVYVDDKTGEIKQQMVRTASKMILSFLKTFNGGVPRHACLQVEYKGKAKGKKYQYDNWAFYPVIQELQNVEAN